MYLRNKRKIYFKYNINYFDLSMTLIATIYLKGAEYWDRCVNANCVDPDQTAPKGVV